MNEAVTYNQKFRLEDEHHQFDMRDDDEVVFFHQVSQLKHNI